MTMSPELQFTVTCKNAIKCTLENPTSSSTQVTQWAWKALTRSVLTSCRTTTNNCYWKFTSEKELTLCSTAKEKTYCPWFRPKSLLTLISRFKTLEKVLGGAGNFLMRAKILVIAWRQVSINSTISQSTPLSSRLVSWYYTELRGFSLWDSKKSLDSWSVCSVLIFEK